MKQRCQMREKLAQQKKQAKSDETAQHLASLQLERDLQQQVQSPTKQSRDSPARKRVTIMVECRNQKPTALVTEKCTCLPNRLYSWVEVSYDIPNCKFKILAHLM